MTSKHQSHSLPPSATKFVSVVTKHGYIQHWYVNHVMWTYIFIDTVPPWIWCESSVFPEPWVAACFACRQVSRLKFTLHICFAFIFLFSDPLCWVGGADKTNSAGLGRCELYLCLLATCLVSQSLLRIKTTLKRGREGSKLWKLLTDQYVKCATT